MIDPHVLTGQPDLVKEHLRRRHAEDAIEHVDRVVALADIRRERVNERDSLRAQRNTLSKQIGGLMRDSTEV